jgi:O-antigen/teichoic acid export membrane protein
MTLFRLLTDRLGLTGGFRSGVLTLMSGSVAAGIIAYVAQPILTRLFPPEAFGVMDAFIAVVALIAPWTAARYEDALLIPEKTEEASAILRLVLLLTFFSVVLLQLIFSAELIPLASVGLSALGPWLVLVPAAILLLRASVLLEGWFTRSRRFGTIAGGQALLSTTMSGTRVGFGALSTGVPGPGGLIGGYVAGYAATAGLYVSLLLRTGKVSMALRLPEVRAVARRYRRFATYGTPAALVASLTARLPFLILLGFFGEASLGLFGRAFAAVAIPLGLISGAIARVFFVEATEAHRRENLAGLTASVHGRLVSMGIFPTVAVLIAGPELFAFVFGSDWRPAGAFAQILAPWLFLASVASPLTRLFDVLERQRSELLFSAIVFTVQTASLVTCSISGSITLALAGLAAGGTLGRLVQLGGMARMADVSTGTLARAYSRYFILCVPGAVLLGASTYFPDDWPSVVALVIGALLYAALLLRRDRLLGSRNRTP